MAVVRPLRGVRFDTTHVDLGSALAPPYDVISDRMRTALYAGNLRNIVRIDDGERYPDDVPGESDRYTRAAQHLEAWLRLGLLRRDDEPALYVHDHTFTDGRGSTRMRRGVLLRVRALPWGESDVIPHEHTLRGPREDRLLLMRATRMQTSAPFLMWDRAAGLRELLEAACERDADQVATTPGANGPEEHALRVLTDPGEIAGVVEALAGARLYVADGHHRFETAAAYAAERRAAEPSTTPDDDSQWTLAYVCDAQDPALEVLPTHRAINPRAGMPESPDDLARRLPAGWTVAATESVDVALQGAARRRDVEHAVAAVTASGTALLTTPRRRDASPRDRLDTSVVQDDILGRALGIDTDAVSGGALSYLQGADEVAERVRAGTAALGLCLVGCTTQEIIDVSDAGQQMPQKSTYFFPKVPTGLVLSPL